MTPLVRTHCELYCYNTEGDINTDVSHASCRMDVTRLEQHAYIKIAILWGRNARECLYRREFFPSASRSTLWHSLAFLSRSIAILMLSCCSSRVTSILYDLWVSIALYYDRRVHCPLLQCLRTRSAILAGTHSYFVVSAFKYEGKK